MKNIIAIFIFVIGFAFTSFGQTQKTIVKSFQNDSYHTVALAFDGEIEVKEWDQNVIRISTTVDAKNFNERTLKYLVTKGRYNYEILEKGGTLIFLMPATEKTVSLHGIDLNEEYNYTISVPKGITVEIIKPDLSDLF
ncbi:MAG: hypothetical protein GY810_30795 [Aureispira sp.]|nr:hypothetical protein [Aureispira sp.]